MAFWLVNWNISVFWFLSRTWHWQRFGTVRSIPDQIVNVDKFETFLSPFVTCASKPASSSPQRRSSPPSDPHSQTTHEKLSSHILLHLSMANPDSY